MRVYVDGVFDLYHRGHLESFKYIKSEEFSKLMNIKSNIHLIVGVVSDKDCESYKRKPIINELDRLELIKYNKFQPHMHHIQLLGQCHQNKDPHQD